MTKILFNPEPTATADVTQPIIELIQRSLKSHDLIACLSAVATGSGLNE
jgi:hypothetical protein